jgi:hypothetical protein
MKVPRFANAGLVLGSLGLAYLILELAVFPFALRHLPLKQHDYVERLGLLAQSSKSGTTPTDYIALAGDSYAQGKGDWLLKSDPDGNGPFHSAHVLHELSGRDVVSFGKGGSGSLEALVTEPLSKYFYIDQSPWYVLDPPRLIIAYIYEGNDFIDNLRTLRKARLLTPGATTATDVEAIERFVADHSARTKNEAGYAMTPVLDYVIKAIKGTLRSEDMFTDLWARVRRHDNTINPDLNVAVIAGERVTLPSKLQAPPIRLTRPEIDSTVQLLGASLAALHRSFPNSDLIVAYLPSPLTTYRFVSETVSIQSGRRSDHIYPIADVVRRSNTLCGMSREAAIAVGGRFLDLRPAMRASGERHVIHGPIDWRHFNRAGYTALGHAVYDFVLADRAADRGCAVM